MTEPTSHPSRLLRWAAGLARWSLGLVLAFWLLAAGLWGLVHGWIVPRVDQWRPQLEQYATQALGTPVRLGSLSARSEGLLPTVELQQVELLNAQGQVALQLPRVVLAVSPRSVLRGGVEQLYIEAPSLDITRNATGQWWVAGLLLQPGQGDNSALADWLFAQAEIVVRGGRLQWLDEQHDTPALALQSVDIVLRNRGRHHALRLDASPPPGWGGRFSVMGQMRQPFFSLHPGAWQRWTGQLYAHFPKLNAAHWSPYLALVGAQVTRGRGSLRAWVDVRQGRPVGMTADVQLAHLHAQWGAQTHALALRNLHGRVQARTWREGWELGTHNLRFTTDDGQHWPASHLQWRHTAATQGSEVHPVQGELLAERIDLALLARLAQALPLEAPAQALLQRLRPAGVLHDLQARWQGNGQHWPVYHVRGRVEGLALAGRPHDAPAHWQPEDFGLQGARAQFDFTQHSGSAQLTLRDGLLLLPGVFEDPLLPLQQLSTTVRWQLEGEGAAQRIAVQADDLRFANADAQGQAQLRWRTSDPTQSASGSRFPGVLDLHGQLQRADGTRVHRYLPLAIEADVRHYVRDAVRAGQSQQVQFKVRGDLHELPFSHPQQGDFYIAAKIRDATYAYVPPTLQTAGEPPWPVLHQLSGELVFDRYSMAVRKAQASIQGHPQVRLGSIEAQIPNLLHSVVQVQAQGRGPLPELLAQVTHSPLAALTSHALDHAHSSGPADLRLQLTLPIATLQRSQVQGSVTFTGNNEIRLQPDTPLLTQVRGSVQFSEKGFGLAGVQAQALGGSVRLEGGMRASDAPIQLRAQGVASAAGLRQASELGLLAHLAQHASGSTPYQVELSIQQGQPALQVSSNLQGLALDLPAPLHKPAQTSQALHFERRALPAESGPAHELTLLQLEGLGQVQYERSTHGPLPQVLRGAIAWGQEEGTQQVVSQPLPSQGVAANVRLDTLDIDAWQQLLQASSSDLHDPTLHDYLPQRIALRSEHLQWQGRQLHQVVAGLTQHNGIWQASLDARELSGHLAYHLPTAQEPGGSLHARLARLALPPSARTQVNRLLDPQPGHLPALDIDVQALELGGLQLGHLQLQADNRGGQGGVAREWRLSRLQLHTPEAQLRASGRWALLSPSSGADIRHTDLQLRLDVQDSGELLARLGLPATLRRGKGRLEGRIGWQGSPLQPDYASMDGQLRMDMESGQFLKAEPGLAKLLGVLSLQSLPRRLTLDFRDVFSDGFAFDFVRGDVQVQQGVARTQNLQMKGVNAAVLMQGQADLGQETQDLHVVVVPEINAMTASLVASAINPVLGLSSLLAQAVLRAPLAAATTQEFRIAGSWEDPQVERLQRRSPAAADDTPPPQKSPALAAASATPVAPTPAAAPAATP